MVTASHNPPADNGYKVYLGAGAQIVPPQDADIAARIAVVDPTAVPMAPADDAAIERLGRVRRRRLHRHRCAPSGCARRPRGIPIAYTPMHGVGGELVLRAFDAAGLPSPYAVTEQFDPDPTFPTVAFPNPEEPGAMDRVIALADRAGRPARPGQRPRRRPPRGGDPATGRLVAAPRRRRDRVAARRPPADPHDRRRSPRRDDARVVVAARHDGRRPRCPLRGDVHRVQVDGAGRARPPAAAAAVRLRAGARLPRDVAAARQGRHLGRRAVRRGRGASPPRRAPRCRDASTTSPLATAATSSPNGRCG